MTKKQFLLTSSALVGCLALLPNPGHAQTNGLIGEYFKNTELSGSPSLTRTDANIGFNWGYVTPGKPIGVDLYSVRWTGQIQAPATGDFYFTTYSDDGVRLWIDGRQVVNNWTVHGPKWDYGAPIRLEAGKRYDIKLEYFEKWGGSLIGLYWRYPGQTQSVVVPTKYLFTSRVTTPPPPPPPPPPPTPTGVFGPPTNLRVKGYWHVGEKRPTDQLSWDPVPGAVSYNVYQYDLRIAAGVKETSYTVPPSLFYDLTYTVTAVDANGNETIPSNTVGALGASDPVIGLPVGLAALPTNVTAVPEWNGGKPRIALSWIRHWSGESHTYNVYRNGVLVSSGVWGLTYIDTNVKPGETYTYYVKGVTPPWIAPAESAASVSVTAAALTGPIDNGVIGKVKVLSVVPNDDSVMINIEAVPKAVDYRAYNVAKPTSFKYSGGGLSIEMNGLEPGKPVQFVVEALDKLGPYQKMDGFYGPGAMDHNGVVTLATNGLGDPSNVPNVLARSDAFTATPQAITLTGAQAFFDTFRGSQPFVQMPSVDPLIIAANGGGTNNASHPYIRELQNDKWIVRNYWGDMENTRVFIMSNHFMETLYDGGTPRTGVPPHNNNASLIMTPKATADFSGGKVLHVTFEVDPHFNDRRWCEVFVAPAGEPLLAAALGTKVPTPSGRLLRWVILGDWHFIEGFSGLDANKNLLAYYLSKDGRGTFNGDARDIDRRRKFDLYLSQTRAMIYEGGVRVRDIAIPAGAISFTKASVYFVHQVYHTSNDRPGAVTTLGKSYYANHRPYADERHWDNMGFEVLTTFPQ